MNDDIEVDFYLCGSYQGKRKISRNSIYGAFLSGNAAQGIKQLREMLDDLNQIPGVQANFSVEK